MPLLKKIENRNNNFNLIRMLAACGVLFSHSYAVCGYSEPEIAEGSGMTLGTLAVAVFFVTSGFLVTGSLLSGRSIVSYVSRRVLRIYPALIVSVLLTVIVCGWWSRLPIKEYWASQETWTYMIKNFTLFTGIAYTLPGVFLSNPLNSTVNVSLWTLPHEIALYAIWGGWWLIARKSLRVFKGIIIATAILTISAHVIGHYLNGSDVFRTLAMFSAGSLLWLSREKIHTRLSFILISLGVMLVADKSFFAIFYLAIPYLVISFANMPLGIGRNYNKIGDYSYGMYIYAYPVQQCIISANPKIVPSAMIVWSFAITITLAVFSWHIIEKRLLRQKLVEVGHVI